MKSFIDPKDLKTTEWIKLRKENHQPTCNYDDYMDNFYIYFVPITDKDVILTYYVDRYAALLFREQDNEVVGICFEALKKSFFPAYINKHWKLSDTKVELNCIKDLSFGIRTIEIPKPAPHYEFQRPTTKNIELEPVYA